MHIRYIYVCVYIYSILLQKCDILEIASASIKRVKIKALLFLDLNFKHVLTCSLSQ